MSGSGDRVNSLREQPEKEGIYGTLPLLREERIWSFVDFSRVNIGLAIATWAFLIGGTLALYVGLKHGIAAILIGNIIGVAIMSLSICVATGKYGIEQYTILRSVLGYNGVRLMVLLALVLYGLGWAAILSIMFGRATTNIVNVALSRNFGEDGSVVIILGVLAIGISWLLLWRGPDSLNKLNRFLAPALVILSLAMLALVFTTTTWGELINAKPIEPLEGSALLNFMVAVELNIAAGIGWWPIMGSLSRLTRTPRAALWPNMLGVFAAAVLGEIVGFLTALTLGSFDPTVWMIPLGGVGFGIIALLFIAVANITSIVAFCYSLGISIRQLGGAPYRMRWSVLTTVLFVPVLLVVVFFPNTLYENFFTFLAWMALLFSSLSGVVLVDFLVIRKRRIDERALYQERPDSPYGFWKGYNPAAFVAIVVGSVTYFSLLNPVTLVNRTPFEFVSASVPTFVVAGVVYLLLTKLFVEPAGRGGYGAIENNRGRRSIATVDKVTEHTNYSTVDSSEDPLYHELERRLEIIESADYKDPARADLPIRDFVLYVGLTVAISVVAFLWGFL